MAGKLHGDLPLLDDAIVYSVAKMAKARKWTQSHAMHLISWFFLARVQSEVLLLQKGTAAEFKDLMPAHRHSGIVITEGKGAKTLHIRWARRKNRPNGSIMIRKCTCCIDDQVGYCVVCTLEPLCATKATGEFLFPDCASHVLSRTIGRTNQKVNAKKHWVGCRCA